MDAGNGGTGSNCGNPVRNHLNKNVSTAMAALEKGPLQKPPPKCK